MNNKLKKIKIGIVGGTGYTGVELLRLLLLHPHADIRCVTSRTLAGTPIGEYFPSLRQQTDLAFTEPNNAQLTDCDVVFFATPHGVAMEKTPTLIDHDTKVIDLSADFRLQDTALFEQWYGMPHACPESLKEAVYGLPEFYRQAVKSARIVANPGCYPTATQLALCPLLAENVIQTDGIVVDAKSGVSGAGREAKVATLFAEVSESFKAYGMDGHRHWPEIQQILEQTAQKTVNLVFIPHLVPMSRGIEITAYAQLKQDVSEQDLLAIVKQAHAQNPFVQVDRAIPETRNVKGSNFCQVSLRRPQGGATVVLTSVIDNLVKGASGQAVQNFNLMFDLPEDCALSQLPLSP